jgi:hypothetical protein
LPNILRQPFSFTRRAGRSLMSAGGWKPSETAPRDGTRIIGWFSDRAIIVFWRDGPEYVNRRATGNRVWYWSDGYSRFREPDCWQPEPPGPDTAEFPIKAPPLAPRGNTRVVKSPAARRRVVEVAPKRELIRKKSHRVFEMPRTWCDQCQRNVTKAEAQSCTSIFCKSKAEAA